MKHNVRLLDQLNILLGRVMRLTYMVLFGWWLDIPFERRQERQLAREVRDVLAFLFDDYGGEIVPNGRVPHAFGYALVMVAIGTLLLRFGRGRGDFTVQVAARGHTSEWSDWKDLQIIQMVLHESDDTADFPRLFGLYDAERLLRAELPRLLDATSEEHWDIVKGKANALFPLPMRIR
ncbi:MAG: hypothetical protein WBE86_04030 [Candidatus Acidiferrales bacterium]